MKKLDLACCLLGVILAARHYYKRKRPVHPGPETRAGWKKYPGNPVLGPDSSTTWQLDINRPGLIKKDAVYHLWYTGQTNDRSWIGYAVSKDLKTWERMSKTPVISPDVPWEKTSVMCPSVIWDEEEGLYKMWYSGGERHPENPIISPGKGWDSSAVYKPYVIYDGSKWMLWYNGRKYGVEQIGVAIHKGEDPGFK